MNSKIPLKQLAERLADRAGIMPAEAELFIKDFFNRVVIEAVESGESVTVDGLGTFAISPDVDNPVTFIPAPEFAAEINEPFAMFRPMEIDESIADEEIEAVRTPDIAQAPEPEPEAEPEPVTEIISEDEEIAEAAETEQAEAADEEAEVTVAEPVINEPEKEPEAPAVSPVLPPELPAEEPAPVLPPELPGTEPEENEAEVETKEEIEEVVTVVPDDVPEEAEAPQPSPVYIPEDEEEFVTYHHQPKSRMGLGFLLGLITGLVVAALALAAYVLFFAEGGSKLF